MSILPMTSPPGIFGTVGGQTTTDEAPIAPFATASVVDADPNSIDTLNIFVNESSPTAGTLSGAGVPTGYSSYTLTGSASQLTDQLRSLVYTPKGVYPGLPLTTTFLLTSRNSSPYSTTDNKTTVTDTSTQQDVLIDNSIVYRGNGVFSIDGRINGDYPIQYLNLYSYSSIEGYPDFDGQKSSVIGLNADGTFEITDYPVGKELSTENALRILPQGVNDFEGPQFEIPFSLTTGITGKRYSAEQDIYSADGNAILSSTYFREDGSRAVAVLSGGQSFDSNYSDRFLNHGMPGSTFIFNPGFGLDVVRQFRVNGEDHDLLSLSGSDFHNSIAEVLRNTSNVGGAAVITDPTTGDAIRLGGVSKAQLIHNQADFTFHP